MEPQCLKVIDHRPWPLPRRPWTMLQTWSDLLFVHWPIAADAVRPLIPGSLELDTFDDTAWIAVIPFRLSGIRLRKWPPIPGATGFLELNVRTYVRHGSMPGIWFFSLDASARLLPAIARAWYQLPYYFARMSLCTGDDGVRFNSLRPSAQPGNPHSTPRIARSETFVSPRRVP
jgi:hypothetical protein